MAARSSARYAYSAPNQLPTPAPSDSSRNTSPHAAYRRPLSPSLQSGRADSLDAFLPPSVDYRKLAYGAAGDVYSFSAHEITMDTPPSDRTNAFFTSTSTQYRLPTPPMRSATLSSRASVDSELGSERSPTSNEGSASQKQPRSSTDSFFSSGASPRPPSPPPSLPTAKPQSGISGGALLSRLFPSRHRFSRDAIVDEDEHHSITTSPPPFSLSPPVSPPRNVSFAHAQSTPSSGPIHPITPPIHRESIHLPPSYTPFLPSPSPPTSPSSSPTPGSTYESEDIKLTYIRSVGQGAFSSVWLARDDGGSFSLSPHADVSERRPSESGARRRRDRKMDGLRPTRQGANLSFSAPSRPNELGALHSIMPVDGSAVADGEPPSGRLVAVKMMDLAVCNANDRTRISFIREVEVLRHISHPNIVSYLHSYTTPEHHCLVLEYISGGELFELVNSDENHARMSEGLLRRIWCELAMAVGWMHNVALVHRDIKLENIMLTTDPFAAPGSGPISLSSLPVSSPLIKLTDFGLARFIDPSSPMLTTRCGSEYYSAPEIIMAQPYDGRQTDAWACGVVLFALATRVLPFDADVDRRTGGNGGREGAEGAAREGGERRKRDTKRSYMHRIAKGEYRWPGEAHSSSGSGTGPGHLRRKSSGMSVATTSSLISSDEGHGHLHPGSVSGHGHGMWPSPSPSNALSLPSTTSPPHSASGETPAGWHSQVAGLGLLTTGDATSASLSTSTSSGSSAYASGSSGSPLGSSPVSSVSSVCPSDGTSDPAPSSSAQVRQSTLPSTDSSSSTPIPTPALTPTPTLLSPAANPLPSTSSYLSPHTAFLPSSSLPESSSQPDVPPSLITPELKAVVARLLVRDPHKRARIVDLWNEPWMRGEGATPIPPEALEGYDNEHLDECGEGEEGESCPSESSAGLRTASRCSSRHGHGHDAEERKGSTTGHEHGEEEGSEWVGMWNSHRRSGSGRLVLAEGERIPSVAREEVALEM